MTEAEWVEKNLTGSTRYWDDLLITGRASLAELPFGGLRDAINRWQDAQTQLEKLLFELGYEAG